MKKPKPTVGSFTTLAPPTSPQRKISSVLTVNPKSRTYSETKSSSEPTLADALQRGQQVLRQALAAEGGTVSLAEVAAQRNADNDQVLNDVQQGRLLAVDVPSEGLRFPRWQFRLQHLETILGAMSDFSPTEKLLFFLNTHTTLRGKTPIEVLSRRNGTPAAVLAAIEDYGVHGAS